MFQRRMIYLQRSCKIQTVLSRKFHGSFPTLNEKNKGNICERCHFLCLKRKSSLNQAKNCLIGKKKKVALKACDKAIKIYQLSQVQYSDGNFNPYLSFLYTKVLSSCHRNRQESRYNFSKMKEKTYQCNAKKMIVPSHNLQKLLTPKLSQCCGKSFLNEKSKHRFKAF